MNTEKNIKTWLSVLLTVLITTGDRRANADFTFGTPTEVPNVNSSSDDIQPDISSDGLSLYFVSSRPYGASYFDVSYFDIWVARRETIDQDWSTPVRLGPPVNSTACEVDPSISGDGLELYFSDGVMDLSGHTRLGGYGDVDIWVTTRVTINDPWGEPKNLGPIVNSQVYEGDPEISADGLSLFFHGHRPGGYGQCDLYVSTRATTLNTWEPPVNLSPPVNSSVMEIDPSISTDGLVLFFCSNRAGGHGAGDLWMSTRASTSVSSWGVPVNLGPIVNTSIDEADPSISSDGSTLYFNRGVWPVGSTWDLWQVEIIPIVDFNADGIVDSTDICIMVNHWGEDYPLCDIGPMPWGDGIVDVQDLIVLAEHLFEEVDDPTLVVHWPLDEAQGDIAYDSVGTCDGTLLGDPVWQPAGGMVDGALQFDGVDDFIFINSIPDSIKGPFSVLTWVKGGAPGQVVISQRGGVNWLCAYTSEGNLMTELKGTGRGSAILPSQAVITDGNWHRIGFVWDGSHRTLYVDGLSVAEDTQGNLEVSENRLYIGTGKDLKSGTYWSGLIDDVRIYDRALIPEEIIELAQ